MLKTFKRAQNTHNATAKYFLYEGINTTTAAAT